MDHRAFKTFKSRQDGEIGICISPNPWYQQLGFMTKLLFGIKIIKIHMPCGGRFHPFSPFPLGSKFCLFRNAMCDSHTLDVGQNLSLCWEKFGEFGIWKPREWIQNSRYVDSASWIWYWKLAALKRSVKYKNHKSHRLNPGKERMTLHLLAAHAPPSSAARSYITKLVTWSCRWSWHAILIPDKPAPIITTSLYNFVCFSMTPVVFEMSNAEFEPVGS